MGRREVIIKLVVLAAGLVVLRWWMTDRGDYRHVVLITLDTTRADHLSVNGGVNGYPQRITPHLDALAQRGVVFSEAFAANTNTAPSHASIMTGLPVPAHGVTFNGHSLRRGAMTLAERLRA